MQWFRYLTLAGLAALLGGCANFTGQQGEALPREAQWGLVPMVNYSQTPLAGERSEQILLSSLTRKGLQPRIYPPARQGDLILVDDRERLAAALDWARQQRLDYVISGSIEEWQYKSGLDGEPAVGISLRVLEPSTGRVLWSNSGARAGWSRESLAGSAQKVIDKLVDDLQLQ
ncbi:penicillin-binding protein activator LpoB [Halopseudomonas nanhaiensis]|uniref:penicillin-binding protein activator LpoB n=1 Tax=Halopseudomonas nanhaiensis TaxID=2830842 RepID=UPI001CBD5AE7|nr:penicillin-binding protein activator LpoB [Halopseudomonas nanhaiensis]UAW99489.1 penicillin-binding protein activator LpoB [Halopseudomonas nanhaiensis]